MKRTQGVELAVVVRVGDRRVPVIVASITDQEMLRATLRRAIAAAAIQADIEGPIPGAPLTCPTRVM